MDPVEKQPVPASAPQIGKGMVADELVKMLADYAVEISHDIKYDLAEVSDYAAERAAHLATVIGEPGFHEALVAERNSVALMMAAESVTNADQIDQRMLAFTQRALRLASGAFAAIV